MSNPESPPDPAPGSATDSRPAGFSRLEDFSRYFDLAPAVTKQQRDQVYQVRYRVYCEEFGYESTEAFSNYQETDEFDSRSAYCLVTHRESGAPVGCVRIVMVEGDELMPMEAHAGDHIDREFIDSFDGRRNSVCEISRLAVDGAFRRRSREQETRFGNIDAIGTSEWERRTFPLIALSLMVGAGAMADALDRKHGFAIMEPFLPVMMRRAGIHFRRVGEDFEFRGVRAPYYGNMDELFDNAPAELRTYFKLMRARFATALQEATMTPVVSAVRPAGEADDSSGRLWWPGTVPEGAA
jgi:N-acyl amino acid synthase of PEP-CTERM/exosortase system